MIPPPRGACVGGRALGTEPALELPASVPCKDQCVCVCVCVYTACVSVRIPRVCVCMCVHSVYMCEDTPCVCVCVCVCMHCVYVCVHVCGRTGSCLQVQLEHRHVGIGPGGPQLQQSSAAPLSPSSWPPRRPRNCFSLPGGQLRLKPQASVDPHPVLPSAPSTRLVLDCRVTHQLVQSFDTDLLSNI